MTRKKIILKKTDYPKIKRLAERGVKETDICKALGISFPTWQRLKKEDEKAIAVFEEARTVEEEALVSKVFEKAMNGDTICLLFLLKTRHGYKEGAEQVNANQLNVKIVLPGSMDSNEYKKLVEVQHDK